MQFEQLLDQDSNAAIRWLEVCRLFLLGPEHYSLGGIHSVAEDTVSTESALSRSQFVFPSDLGVTLVKAFDLIQQRAGIREFTLADCLEVYGNSSLARETLTSLNDLVHEGRITIDSVDELEEQLRAAKADEQRWLRGLRLVAATSVSAALVPFEPVVGILAGLGFGIAAESRHKPMDKALSPIVGRVRNATRPKALTLLLRLDEDVRRKFRPS